MVNNARSTVNMVDYSRQLALNDAMGMRHMENTQHVIIGCGGVMGIT